MLSATLHPHTYPDLQIGWKELHSLQAWKRPAGFLGTVKKHVQPSCSPGVYWLLIKMINYEQWVLLHQTFWNFPCYSTGMWGGNSTPSTILDFYFEKCVPYPDFADGVSEAFVVSSLTECYGIELSFVEVGHGALPLLLTERFGGFQGVLKCTVKRKHRAVSSLDIPPFPSSFMSTVFYVNINKYWLFYRQNTEYSKSNEPKWKVGAGTIYIF